MQSIKEIQNNLGSQYSVVDVVNSCLINIDRGRELNAFIEIFREEALERAKQIDEKWKRNEAGKLAGLVISIKDNILYRGHQCSAGSKMLHDFISPYSSTVVERLIREDAIIIGRTNCDEFGMGSSGEKSFYGKTHNPLDPERVPGGSSSGAAASVAASMCLAALGSDTGGSVRQPAAFCGLIGIKPTFGRVSRWGLIAYASSFDQIGIITKNIEDNIKILEVIAGPDGKDSTLTNENFRYQQDIRISSLKKIAIFKNFLEYEELNPEIKKIILQKADALKKAGHQVDLIDFDYLDQLIPVFHILAPAEAASNLSRYDGIRFGHQSEKYESYKDIIFNSRTEGFGKEVKRRIVVGKYVMTGGRRETYYEKAIAARNMLKKEISEVFKKYDSILSPATPDKAFKFGERTKNTTAMFLEDIFLVMANITGIPSITFPAGMFSNGLPVGIQLSSDCYEEKILYAFSEYLIRLK